MFQDEFLWILLVSFFIAIPAVLTGSASFITLPVLMHFGLDPRTAVGTNKPGILMMMLNGIVGFRRNYRGIPIRYYPILALMLLGSWTGAGLLQQIPGAWIRYGIMGLALAAAVPWRRGERGGVEREVNIRCNGHKRFTLYLYWMIGFIVGVYNGVLGPGALTVFISIFRYRMGLSIQQSIAFGNLVGFLGNLAAGIRFYLMGYVEPSVALAMMVGMLLGAQVGVRIGRRAPAKVLEWLIRVVLLALVVGLLIRGSVS